MKFKTFTVKAKIPERLSGLNKIAYNLWWTWNPEAIDLFRRMDHPLWSEMRHNPVALLANINQQRLEKLATDTVFIAHLDRVEEALDEYMSMSTWAGTKHPEFGDDKIAYFSMEFGLHECLPVYSGGLGILAGDHFKSTSELGLPMVGVGLMYRQGYFHQYLSQDGWQQEEYKENLFHELPAELVCGSDNRPLRVEVKLSDRTLYIQGWKVQVGRVPLYLLDTRIDRNSESDQAITERLYGSGKDVRILQEIVLGIGGIRFLHAMKIMPAVCHMNEGHAAFLGMERVRILMKENGLDFHEALEAVRAGNVFTTHTPVPAGIDLFSEEAIRTIFEPLAEDMGVTVHALMALGRQTPFNQEEPLSMAVLAIRLSGHRNGVSRLHGQISRKMWSSVWKTLPAAEVPIGHVTNGIHVRSWLSDEMARLFDRYLGPDWVADPLNQEIWSRIQEIPDNEFWRAKERLKERLVGWTRHMVAQQLHRLGADARQVNEADEILDPEVLTLGFARRFATYKRGTLLFYDPERFQRIINHPTRPVQVIFAGKAHPDDQEGKKLIQNIVEHCRRPEFKNRVVFLEDYEINIARYLVQGVDVWLNTPRRPLEASGTSGMKVCPNGGLHLSVLDGWWDEAFDPDVGWAIGRGEIYDDPNIQDEIEAKALYDVLEREVAPLYYAQGEDGLPRGWIEKMKASVERLSPVFNTNRMVREYSEFYYLPSLELWHKLSAQDFGQARKLANWRKEIEGNWKNVKIEEVSVPDRAELAVGDQLEVSCLVDTGGLAPDSLRVELYHGSIGPDGEVSDGIRTPLQRQKETGENLFRYGGRLVCDSSGKFGVAIIVYPFTDELPSPFDLGLIVVN